MSETQIPSYTSFLVFADMMQSGPDGNGLPSDYLPPCEGTQVIWRRDDGNWFNSHDDRTNQLTRFPTSAEFPRAAELNWGLEHLRVPADLLAMPLANGLPGHEQWAVMAQRTEGSHLLGIVSVPTLVVGVADGVPVHEAYGMSIYGFVDTSYQLCRDWGMKRPPSRSFLSNAWGAVTGLFRNR